MSPAPTRPNPPKLISPTVSANCAGAHCEWLVCALLLLISCCHATPSNCATSPVIATPWLGNAALPAPKCIAPRSNPDSLNSSSLCNGRLRTTILCPCLCGCHANVMGSLSLLDLLRGGGKSTPTPCRSEYTCQFTAWPGWRG